MGNRVAFVLASTDHGPLIVNRLDFQVQPGGGSIGVGAELLGTGRYFNDAELELQMNLFALLKKTRSAPIEIVDAGANIGIATLVWAKLVEGWGKVTAIEAQERLYYALCGNVALNNCFNARAMLAAVADVSGKGILVPHLDYQKPSNFGGLSLLPTIPGGSAIGQPMDRKRGNMVPTVAIDDLQIPRIDFVKLDVEGMEIEALKGMKTVIAEDKPVFLIEHIKVGAEAIEKALPGYRFFTANMDVCAIHRSDPIWNDLKIREEAAA